MDLPVFHLSFPVRDLAEAKHFYCGLLGASVGRDNGQWADIVLFGHQLTLHERPDEVLPPSEQGVRHFGAILPWTAWDALASSLAAAGAALVSAPAVAHAGTPREQGKLLIRDPSGNLLEIKAYRDVRAALAPATPDPIRTVAAVIANGEGKILLVRKRTSTIFIQPGGKIDAGEVPLVALARELREELGVELVVGSARRLGEFEDVAVNEPGRRVRAEAFLCSVIGEPAPSAEIDELVWVDPAGPYPVPVAPLSAHHILPSLARPATQSLGLVSLVVRDYDEAIAFFVGTLGFDLVEDRLVPEQSKRWVVVSPPGAVESRLLLARASTPAQEACIGAQTGGRVFLFLHTDDIWRDFAVYRSRGVRFVREPNEEPYGTVAVFLDLYGNPWDLLQAAP